MLPTHATARLPIGVPAGPLHDLALLDPEFAARRPWALLQVRRHGNGRLGEQHGGLDSGHATEAPAPIWKATA